MVGDRRDYSDDVPRLLVEVILRGALVTGGLRFPLPGVAAGEHRKYLFTTDKRILVPDAVLERHKLYEPQQQPLAPREGEQICNFLIVEISDEDGWALLSEIGNILVKRCPSFDVRNYGFSKLTPYVKSLNSFEIDSVPSANGSVKYIYIRRKQ